MARAAPRVLRCAAWGALAAAVSMGFGAGEARRAEPAQTTGDTPAIDGHAPPLRFERLRLDPRDERHAPDLVVTQLVNTPSNAR